MSERRLEATVIGPGASGLLKVSVGRAALDEIQEQMRLVLNECWDPIGVAADVADEYDTYIAQLYGLLQRETDDAIVERLRRIDVESMGLREPSRDRLRQVVARLRQLNVPPLEAD